MVKHSNAKHGFSNYSNVKSEIVSQFNLENRGINDLLHEAMQYHI